MGPLATSPITFPRVSTNPLSLYLDCISKVPSLVVFQDPVSLAPKALFATESLPCRDQSRPVLATAAPVVARKALITAIKTVRPHGRKTDQGYNLALLPCTSLI